MEKTISAESTDVISLNEVSGCVHALTLLVKINHFVCVCVCLKLWS